MIVSTSDMKIEKIRQEYKPDKVKVLLIGESAPIAGTFFYTGDSLCKYTQDAFTKAYPELKTKTWQEFLKFFQQNGFYLDDLCLNPVNGMDRAIRRQHLESYIPSLATRIKVYSPSVLIIMLKGIKKYILQSLQLSEIDAQTYTVPFGGMGHQNHYIKELSEILNNLKERDIDNQR